MRIIYSDAPGIEALAQRRLLGGGVCAVVGPFGKHTSQPELQDALALVMMAFNRRHGHLSPEKYRELLGGRDYGEAVKLLREALPQPRATPSKLDPILEEMREAFLAQGVPGEEIPF